MRTPTALAGVIAVTALAVGAFGFATTAQAQSLSGNFPEGGEGSTQERTHDDEATPEQTQQLSWNSGVRRYFIAGAFDLGFLYIRPRFQFGYGQPHARWFGFDINPIVAPGGGGIYGGFRIDMPFVDWRIGARYIYPFVRSYLPLKDSYSRTDLNREDENEGSHYLSAETEVTLTLPVGNGRLFSESALSYVTLVPEDRAVFEDTIKVVVHTSPWVWRQRIGYEARFGETDAVRIGLAVEAVGVPGRDLIAIRAGVLMRIWASPRLEIRGSWIPAIISRDDLGIRGGDFGLLGVRYRWSTGGITGHQGGPPAVLPQMRGGEEQGLDEPGIDDRPPLRRQPDTDVRADDN